MRITSFGRIAEPLPLIGQGTWKIGESAASKSDEAAALQRGLDYGMNLIDTAEMYADGGAEEVVGEAITGRRDEVFLVSKVQPQNASRKGTIEACQRSLQRLKTDVIDLYLLHWPGDHPLADTIAAFQELREAGKIRYWGVSNFGMAELRECERIAEGENVTNQVLYNLQRRGIERDMRDWSREHGVMIMAYSPLDQMRLKHKKELKDVAERHGVTSEQIALAWCIRRKGFITIPKSSSPKHVKENAAAAEIQLTEQDLKDLNKAYPAPEQPTELEWL